ncbi:MAG: alpha/beta hydrolase [Chloroflexi bacterium]|nr:alpha/beta hydrolase [Chloroflexota bacterium]
MLNFLKRRWWLLLLLPLLLVLGFVGWALLGPQPMPEALAALESDPQVTVQQTDWLVFQPATTSPTTGLILYPGGRVDERAYAPAAHALAAQGYLVVLVPMPLNFAVFAPERASEVVDAFPAIEHWAIGGHSLGGAMAAQFAHDHPDLIDGLALWASYPPGGASLADQQLAVVSIFGTRDGVAKPEDIEASRGLLPQDTSWVAIEGGNHAQFGWYGPQSGDLQATISREEQQAQTVAATLALLQQLDRGGP